MIPWFVILLIFLASAFPVFLFVLLAYLYGRGAEGVRAFVEVEVKDRPLREPAELMSMLLNPDCLCAECIRQCCYSVWLKYVGCTCSNCPQNPLMTCTGYLSNGA